MNEKIEKRNYVNPQSDKMCRFATEMNKDTNSLEEVVHNIFEWFNNNVKYSRLEQPYYPLQRNDLEVLEMKAGTCGDYSNLIVSVFINMGVPAKYAYIKRDCYGDEQDHICAAVEINHRWILIDGTMPYRKWYGFDCQHQEYELYDSKEFEIMMKKKEDEFYNKALRVGKENLAGLLYAPWIHDEKILDTKDKAESVFYLLSVNKNLNWTLWVSYIVYTKDKGYIPLTIRVNQDMKRVFQFSVKKPNGVWDDNQWGEEYLFDEIPESFKSEYFHRCLKSMDDKVETIRDIILNI